MDTGVREIAAQAVDDLPSPRWRQLDPDGVQELRALNLSKRLADSYLVPNRDEQPLDEPP